MTAGTALGVLALVVIAALVRNSRTRPDAVGGFLFSGPLLEGVVVTVRLTVISQILGLVPGFLLSLAGRSRNPVARTVDFSFTAVFRGTPLLVQLLLRHNLALFVPHMTLGIPWTGWTHTWDTNSVITGFASAPSPSAARPCSAGSCPRARPRRERRREPPARRRRSRTAGQGGQRP